MQRALTGLLVAGLFGLAAWAVIRIADQAPLGGPVQAASGTLPDTSRLYDPVRAGEPLPDGFRQLIRRDGIAPIYEPAYVAAADAIWRDDTLVVGVAIDDQARAYPVGVLNRREMVIDRIAGIPVLVSW